MITIGRGYRQQNSILKPSNNGMSVVAKNRLTQAVGMQNALTVEALKVDGVPLQIFTKRLSGQKCSCCVNNTVNNNGNNPLSVSDSLNDFKVQDFVVEGEDYDDIPTNTDNYDNILMADNSTDKLTEDLISELAIDDSNSLVFGGDKTPCGICYGSGYKNSYDLFNGQRIVLDYFDKPILEGFTIERTYPYSFISDYSSDSSIMWCVRLPTFFKKYIGIRVRNNVSYCKDYCMYVSFDGLNFIQYEDSLVAERNGNETTMLIKIVPYNLGQQPKPFTITHLELFFQLADFPYGDFEPIQKSENWEFFEALQTTTLELAGNGCYIERESIISDSKNNLLWKVVAVTPHYTAERQIFKTVIELRMIQQSETLYCLNLINNPFIVLNYRGLEQKQGLLTYSGEYKE